MKLTVVLSAAALLVTVGLYAENITASNGTKYQNVTISRVEPDGLVIVTADGIQKLFFSNLNKEICDKYGYDPAKAAAFTDAFSKAQQASLNKQEQELHKIEAQHKANVTAQQPLASIKDFPRYAPPGGVLAKLAKPNQFEIDHNRGMYFNAQEVLAFYADNELKGDAVLKGRRLTVRGDTLRVAKDLDGNPAVYLWAGASEYQRVICIFATAESIMDIHPGQLLYIYGKVKSGAQDEVKLTECEVTAYADGR